MSNTTDTFLNGGNIDFIEALHARYLQDPTSVDPSWAELFQAAVGGRPLSTVDLDALRQRTGRVAAPGGDARQVPMGLQGKVDQTIFSFRLRGHLLASLDPLGIPRPPLEHVADIGMVSRAHFTDAELATVVDTQGVFDQPQTLLRVLERLRRTYTRRIGVEYLHILDSERRRWLMRRMESSENATDFTTAERLRILRKLAQAEAFETTIDTKFKAAKRFSVEGGDSLLPMLDGFLEWGGTLGMQEVVFGMAHRGRLNILTNILGKRPDNIFSEFMGPENPKQYLNRGDVKYHLGFSNDWWTQAGQKIHLSAAFNPSHLGVVHPVVEGRVRAKQDRFGPGGDHAIVPLIVHGDAAFSGQGLVPETLNLAGLSGYSTGGTIHVIINNQIGYTTEASQGRSAHYCTAVAQMLDIPIFHVNGDDPESCVHVMRIAAEYRQRFHTDVVIDLVCYRKYGHNEGDEPAFTQPKMYELIRAHRTPRQLYSDALVSQQVANAAECDALYQEALTGFGEAHARVRAKNVLEDPSALGGVWAPYRGGFDRDTPQVDTGVPASRLKNALVRLTELPADFVPHQGVQKVLEKRKKMISGAEPLDWGAAEMLAYATLIEDGYHIRVTGQDTERGTFAHRHAVIHDTVTGAASFTLDAFKNGRSRAAVINSPLSEMACLGFEFGYSLDAPDSLVAWEAQFGDFANNGQVIIDQFIAAAEDKWCRLSGLTLLLPHGYEGAGPEHSSARLERFLELAAEDNIQVCYPTTAAQIFHLLRRQVVRPIRKPLVVMTPKSLLRLADASSPMGECILGRFQRVIPEVSATISAPAVTRLLLCSGKVYFDLAKARQATDSWVAIARLEQLYPLPESELTATLARYPNLQEVCWVQEEPKNSGAWRYLVESLWELASKLPSKPKVRYLGRVESASPATGFPKAHEVEQRMLVDEALTKGTHVN